MIEPDHNQLPWRDDGFGIRDANGETVQIYGHDRKEPANRRLIVAAVSPHADLLSAAKAIYQSVHGDAVAIGPLWGRLYAAISAAEEPAP